MKSSGNKIFDAAYIATGHNKKKAIEIVLIIDEINKMGGFTELLK